MIVRAILIEMDENGVIKLTPQGVPSFVDALALLHDGESVIWAQMKAEAERQAKLQPAPVRILVPN